MKRLAAAVVMAALALWANPSAQAAGQRVIVTFKSGTPEQARVSALKALGAVPVQNGLIESDDQAKKFIAVVAEVPALSLPAGAAALAKRFMGLDEAPPAEVVSVERDFKIKWIESSGVSFQETPFHASLADLGLKALVANVSKASVRGETPWGVERVKAAAAWANHATGAGVKVAVIDTGIDYKHSELSGKVDGGYNAITDSEAPESYKDDNGHGTHVAGTIAAKKDGRGVVGVAPDARLYAVKVLDADGSGSLSGVIKGIIWAANNHIQVANMSLGSPQGSDTMQRALRYAKARGVVVVAAAGNSGATDSPQVGYPAAYPETIAVAASDWSDHVARFSSRGPEVKFIAPGVAIVSSALGGDYANLSGTSMATPHVAGLAALAVGQGYRGLDGPDGVFEQLKKAARPLPGLSAQEQGMGMIDAGRLTESPAAMATASLP